MQRQDKGRVVKGLLMLVALAVALAGCTHKQARKPLAPYAVATGGMAWSVTCPGGAVASDFSDNEVFYDANGQLKELDRFCEEMQAGSRIRRVR